ncbi:MAG: alpha-amylase family glycosyl hydrolase [Cryomorphaceae bacterium]
MRFAINGTLAAAILIITGGCSDQSSEMARELNPGNAIMGLASPVKLNTDTTQIYLLDYFENAALIDSFRFSHKLDFDFDSSSGELSAYAVNGLPPVFNLRIFYDGHVYDIPVFKSVRQEYSFTYEPSGTGVETVSVKGSFNGWNHKATVLREENGIFTAELSLKPGLYEYLLVQDGEEMLDPTNDEKKSNGQGGFNSIFRVGEEMSAPEISTYGITEDSLVVFYPKSLGEPIVYFDNFQVDLAAMKRRGDRLSFAIPEFTEDLKRSFARVYGSEGNLRSNDLLIPLSNGKPIAYASELSRNDKHTWSMYFMMVDRFVNADTANDEMVNDPDILPPANYYGGDLKGVTAKIEDDYFGKLGMNTVWLSPITQNPLGSYGLWDKGGVKSKFSGYHGYWPISSSKVDHRFGIDSSLSELISEAHQGNMNVILDYVANHVHEEHPVYQQHPEWATELYLPDGSLNTEKWDEYRLTTWFDTFMPTLDLRKNEVVEAMTDSALFWFENYELDGFRHDATKHIPLKFWRSLTRKLKYEVAIPENRTIYQIGETYGNPDLIDSYIGSGLLDGQFDFNLYDAAVSAFAKSDGGLQNLKRVLEQSLSVYGNHHLMGNISGNQDRARFISYADGSVEFSEDPKLAGWTRRIEIRDTIGYNRLLALHAFNFSIPGIPVIYYGDEIGLPGANDPDNRRMMRFGNDISEKEAETLATTRRISNLRNQKMALLYGDLKVLDVSDHSIAYLRNYFQESAIVIFNNSLVEQTIRLAIPNRYNLKELEANFGNSFNVKDDSLEITLPPVSFEILTN